MSIVLPSVWPPARPDAEPSRGSVLLNALHSPHVRRRYETKVMVRGQACWPWLGALTSHGHGRFWIGRQPTRDGRRTDHVMIAHRFGYALRHGFRALEEAPVLAHACDEPWCQNPEHLEISTQADNHHDWLTRRWHPRSPLRDTRGQHGRAVAIRAAARSGLDIATVMDAGVSDLDQGQLTLW